MKIFWWQGGLQVEPVSNNERQLLAALYESLKAADFGREVRASPVAVVDGHDQESVRHLAV